MEGKGLEEEDIRIEDKESKPTQQPTTKPNQSLWAKLSRSFSSKFGSLYGKVSRQPSNVSSSELPLSKQPKMAASLDKLRKFPLMFTKYF